LAARTNTTEARFGVKDSLRDPLPSEKIEHFIWYLSFANRNCKCSRCSFLGWLPAHSNSPQLYSLLFCTDKIQQWMNCCVFHSIWCESQLVQTTCIFASTLGEHPLLFAMQPAAYRYQCYLSRWTIVVDWGWLPFASSAVAKRGVVFWLNSVSHEQLHRMLSLSRSSLFLCIYLFSLTWGEEPFCWQHVSMCVCGRYRHAVNYCVARACKCSRPIASSLLQMNSSIHLTQFALFVQTNSLTSPTNFFESSAHGNDVLTACLCCSRSLSLDVCTGWDVLIWKITSSVMLYVIFLGWSFLDCVISYNSLTCFKVENFQQCPLL